MTNTLVAPLHDALTSRFPDLGIVVADYGPTAVVTFKWKGELFRTQTPDTMDWRANEYRWWLHKFTDIIARKTGQ